MKTIKVVQVFFYEKRKKFVVNTNKVYSFRITNRTQDKDKIKIGSSVLVNTINNGEKTRKSAFVGNILNVTGEIAVQQAKQLKTVHKVIFFKKPPLMKYYFVKGLKKHFPNNVRK